MNEIICSYCERKIDEEKDMPIKIPYYCPRDQEDRIAYFCDTDCLLKETDRMLLNKMITLELRNKVYDIVLDQIENQWSEFVKEILKGRKANK